VTVVYEQDALRQAILRATTGHGGCSTCKRPFTLAEIARASGVGYASLHKFAHGKYKRIFPESALKMEKWFRGRGLI
jgi:hypothetical protein